ncbi:type II toxin-antitoxin system YhaV family toxin [Atlantibacter subterraneus]|uniref:type II toxin-antitoxin system YhaV family toxin n=1 Tax=Atlantibacter subterraneus TaxID=255519 RepID=UPI0028ADD350|nr:type II toxin-antitoxin system YhaV family toxin [Atlantibacter subterranea]
MNGMRAVGPWKVYQHPCFVAQVKALRDEVAALKHHYPDDYRNKAATRLLAAINKARKDISADPTQAKYRLGDTLGAGYRHWFRAKFLGQYRLFFRYSLRERIIILAWVNDSQTKRAYGNKRDAYKVFGEMLASGYPPDDWEALLKETMKQVSLSLCEPQP